MPRREFKPIPQLTDLEIANFESYIKKRSAKECWPWIGYSPDDGGGYGRVTIRGIGFIAHRVAYFIATGKDPEEMRVCHSCDNPPCCNTAHHFLGTDGDNMRDRTQKGRSPKGIKNGRAKLTEAQVREIKAMLASKQFSQQEIADRFGVNQTMIGFIHRGVQWSHITI